MPADVGLLKNPMREDKAGWGLGSCDVGRRYKAACCHGLRGRCALPLAFGFILCLQKKCPATYVDILTLVYLYTVAFDDFKNNRYVLMYLT